MGRSLGFGLGRSGRSGRSGCSGDGGQIVPLVAAIVVLAGLLATAVGRVGQRAIASARADSAADAAALAGARAGRSAARDLAGENGGRLVGYVARHQGVAVLVEVDGVRAAASAEVGRERPSGELAPAMAAVLGRAGQLSGAPVNVAEVTDEGLRVRVDEPVASALRAAGQTAGLCPSAAPGGDWFEVCPASQ